MARTDYYGIQTPVLQATSQAIRTVNGTVGTIAPEDYPDLISAMKSGTDYDNVMAQLVEETTTPASIASFTDGANNLPVKELICTINPTETGTGAKSPSNPYVIGGHTGINITQMGVNLWDEQWEIGGYYNNTGLPRELNDRIRCKNPIRVESGMNIYTPFYVAFLFYDKNDNVLTASAITGYSRSDNAYNRQSSNVSGIFPVPNDAYYMRFYMYASYGTTYNNDISINVPATDTAYHAYNGQTHTASFGQTVYGGELNVTTGVLTVTHKKIVIDGTQDIGLANWRPQTNSVGWLYSAILTDVKKPSSSQLPNALSDKLSAVSYDSAYSNDIDCFAIVPGTVHNLAIRVRDTSLTTKSLINAYLTNNPITIVYEIDETEQFDIQLDPIEVRTLLGANNIYHDCNGNTKVTYRANGALYVAQH